MNQRLLYRVILTTILLMLCCPGCTQNSSGNKDSETSSSTDTDPSTEPGIATDTDEQKVTVEMQNETVFSQEQMLEYHITIDEAALADMDANGDDEEYRVASLHVLGTGVDESFEQVGFRYKGNWSLHHCWDAFDGVRSHDGVCERLSTKIKFNEYDKDARLFGLKKINLHSMMGDATKLRERLSYSLFNDFGVTASRTAHAKLYVNGAYAGLVIAVEAVDGRFTHFRYPEGGNGNLYKELWPNANVTEELALAQLETNNKTEDNPNVTDFFTLRDAIIQSTADNFETRMASHISIEQIIRYLAVDRAIRNWDGLMAFYAADMTHNFYWYHDDGAGKMFHLIPWDLDNTMGEFDLFMDPQSWCDAEPVPNWNEKPLNCDGRITCADDGVTVVPPRCDQFIDLLATTQWERFAAIGKELLSDVLTYEAMDAKITTWAAQIRDALEEDPLVDVVEWEAQVEQFRSILKDAVYDFQKHVKTGLVDEFEPTPGDESLSNDPIALGGLRVDVVNNFEFEDATETSLADYTGSFSYSGVELAQIWNSDAPILGTGDMKISADFIPYNGSWSEYAGFQYFAEEAVDLTPYTYLWFSASANMDARIRMELLSDNYSQYGDVWPVFSKEFSVTTSPEIYRVDIQDLTYPQWAKDVWTATDGWRTTDAEALAFILQKFSGITVQIFPSSDSQGNMIYDTETVSVQLDNIYFE